MSDIESGSGTASPGSTGTAAPATQGSVETGSVPSTESTVQETQGGAPPQERWPDILENARRKTRAEVEQEFKTRYGGFEQFDQDPLNFIGNWIDQASQHSLVGDTVKRAILERAQRWQQPQQTRQVSEAPKPDVPIVDEHGRVTGHTYSAEQLAKWQDWNQENLLAKLEERFGPLENFSQQQAERMEYEAQRQMAGQKADSTLSQLRQNPYFKDNEARIKQVFAEHPEFGDNVHQAFTHVLVNEILPTLSTAERKTAVEALTGKSAGNTVNPNATQTRAPKFKSYKDAARYYDQHPEEAAAMAKRSR